MDGKGRVAMLEASSNHNGDWNEDDETSSRGSKPQTLQTDKLFL